jgi:uncharacterized membrane protein YheB (UPF0754 family)
MELLTRIESNWLVLLIPLIAGLVGWGTNVLALRMSFYPVDFVGIPPYLGWRGVIPSNAEKLSQSMIQLLTEKLLDVKELFAGSEQGLDKDLDPMVKRITKQVVQEISTEIAPEKWARSHQALRDYIVEMIEKSTRKVVLSILTDFKENADQIIDLESVVIDAIRKDAGLLGHVFTEVAGPELKFIERSGFWFGLLFGLVQMAVWIYFPAWWVLPAGGFAVGYITNFLALRLVFEPHDPINLGFFKLQGLLHKRKNEVAECFASVMADDVLSPDNMLATVTEGSSKDRMFGLVEKRIGIVFEEYKSDPMTAMLMPPERITQAKEELLEQMRTNKPEPDGLIRSFVDKAVTLRGQLSSKLQALDAQSFEGVLRPAFQEDEWKLFVTGAVLGTIAGVLQLIYLFGGSLG